MSLTTYLAGGSILAVALIYGYFTLQNRAKDARLEAAAALIDVQRSQLDQAAVVNDGNLATIAAIKADLKRQADVAAKAQEAATKRAAELATKLKRIQDAPATDDGAVAPVLRNALDGIRADSVHPPVGNPAPNSPDAGATGAPASEPVGPPLPGETPAT